MSPWNGCQKTHFISVWSWPKYSLKDDDGSRTSKKKLEKHLMLARNVFQEVL